MIAVSDITVTPSVLTSVVFSSEMTPAAPVLPEMPIAFNVPSPLQGWDTLPASPEALATVFRQLGNELEASHAWVSECIAKFSEHLASSHQLPISEVLNGKPIELPTAEVRSSLSTHASQSSIVEDPRTPIAQNLAIKSSVTSTLQTPVGGTTVTPVIPQPEGTSVASPATSPVSEMPVLPSQPRVEDHPLPTIPRSEAPIVGTPLIPTLQMPVVGTTVTPVISQPEGTSVASPAIPPVSEMPVLPSQPRVEDYSLPTIPRSEAPIVGTPLIPTLQMPVGGMTVTPVISQPEGTSVASPAIPPVSEMPVLPSQPRVEDHSLPTIPRSEAPIVGTPLIPTLQMPVVGTTVTPVISQPEGTSVASLATPSVSEMPVLPLQPRVEGHPLSTIPRSEAPIVGTPLIPTLQMPVGGTTVTSVISQPEGTSVASPVTPPVSEMPVLPLQPRVEGHPLAAVLTRDVHVGGIPLTAQLEGKPLEKPIAGDPPVLHTSPSIQRTQFSEGETEVLTVAVPTQPVVNGIVQPVVVETAMTLPSEVATQRMETMRMAAEAVVSTMTVSPELVKTGTGEIHIQLKKEILDGSSVRLEARGGELKIVLTPATQEAAAVLETHLESFRVHLAERVANWRINIGVTAWDPKTKLGRMEREE